MQTEVNKSADTLTKICRVIFYITSFICGIEAMVGFKVIMHLIWSNCPDWPGYIFGGMLGFSWWALVEVIHKHFHIGDYVK